MDKTDLLNSKLDMSKYPQVQSHINNALENLDKVREELYFYIKNFPEEVDIFDVLYKYKQKGRFLEAKTKIKCFSLKSEGEFVNEWEGNIRPNRFKTFPETIKLIDDKLILDVIFSFFPPKFNTGYHTDAYETIVCFFRLTEKNNSSLKVEFQNGESILLNDFKDHICFYSYRPHTGYVIGDELVETFAMTFNVLKNNH